jgi:hypothetical protein
MLGSMPENRILEENGGVSSLWDMNRDTWSYTAVTKAQLKSHNKIGLGLWSEREDYKLSPCNSVNEKNHSKKRHILKRETGEEHQESSKR